MKLVFLLGSRGEWGYIRPIIQRAQESGHEVKICAVNMAVLYEYGDLASKISREGYPVDFRILSSISGDNLPSMAKGIGLLQISLIDYLQSYQPDWLILSGDRAEQLAGAISGSFCYLPTAHIQAGEISGNIDGVTRHAITKLVHLHFASNEDARSRLLKMGEQEFRVHLTGAPQLDDIVNCEKYSKKDLVKRGIIKSLSKYLVACFHPDTNALDVSKFHLKNLIEALSSIELEVAWIFPNNDAGGTYIKNYVLQNTGSRSFLHTNLPRQDYISLLYNAELMIGNSSSGILEAPSLKLPAVNIGDRQNGRIQGQNVINVGGNSVEEIIEGMNLAIKMKESDALSMCPSPYGDGHSSDKILKILEEIKIDGDFLNKKLTY